MLTALAADYLFRCQLVANLDRYVSATMIDLYVKELFNHKIFNEARILEIKCIYF